MKKISKILFLLTVPLLVGCNPTNSSTISSSELTSSISSYVPQEHEMEVMDSNPDVFYYEHGGLTTSLGVDLYKDENVWLKYTATFDSVYCFRIISTEEYGFSAYWDMKGTPIASFDVSEKNGNKVVNGYTQYNGFYDLQMKKNQSIYFNLTNITDKRTALLAFAVAILRSDGIVGMMLPEGIERHTHTYGFSFEQYDDKQHKSFCWKDQEYVLEDHHFDSDGVCSDCGYKK